MKFRLTAYLVMTMIICLTNAVAKIEHLVLYYDYDKESNTGLASNVPSGLGYPGLEHPALHFAPDCLPSRTGKGQSVNRWMAPEWWATGAGNGTPATTPLVKN